LYRYVEVLSAAFQHVVQRRSTPAAAAAAAADVDVNAAAQHLLRAAEVLATAVSRHVSPSGGSHGRGVDDANDGGGDGGDGGLNGIDGTAAAAAASGAGTATSSSTASLVEDVAASFTSTVARLGSLSLSDGSGDGLNRKNTTNITPDAAPSSPATLHVDSLEYLAASATMCLVRLTRLIEDED
jgi:hypothetical protein